MLAQITRSWYVSLKTITVYWKMTVCRTFSLCSRSFISARSPDKKGKRVGSLGEHRQCIDVPVGLALQGLG